MKIYTNFKYLVTVAFKKKKKIQKRKKKKKKIGWKQLHIKSLKVWQKICVRN